MISGQARYRGVQEEAAVSDAQHSPAATRRALGHQLRDLRLGAGLTVADAAGQAGFSPSRLSKIELAQAAVTVRDVEDLLAVYGAADPAQRTLLLDMTRDAGRREWWEGRRAVPAKFAAYLGLEQVATSLQAYDTHLVHGLLQTPAYAAALISAARPDLLGHEVAELVEVRTRRQDILTRPSPDPPAFVSVMDEAVLRRHIGGRQAMHDQLRHLITAAALPAVTLRVIPASLGAHPGLDGPLAILQFEAGARPVAYVEGQAGSLYMEKDDDLRRLAQTMHNIIAAAPSPEDSLALITQIAEELQP
jgi:transcriptional regulator with XRE-family HTH domain